MSVDPFTLGAGALGAITQKDSNNQQEGLAQQQLAQQQGLIQRQEGLFDTLQNIAKQADAQGYFDPTKRLNLMQNQVDYDRNNALLRFGDASLYVQYQGQDAWAAIRGKEEQPAHNANHTYQFLRMRMVDPSEISSPAAQP